MVKRRDSHKKEKKIPTKLDQSKILMFWKTGWSSVDSDMWRETVRMWPHIADNLTPLWGLTHSQKGGEEAKAFPTDRMVLSNQALSTFGILDSRSTLRKTEHIFAVWQSLFGK